MKKLVFFIIAIMLISVPSRSQTLKVYDAGSTNTLQSSTTSASKIDTVTETINLINQGLTFTGLASTDSFVIYVEYDTVAGCGGALPKITMKYGYGVEPSILNETIKAPDFVSVSLPYDSIADGTLLSDSIGDGSRFTVPYKLATRLYLYFMTVASDTGHFTTSMEINVNSVVLGHSK